MEPMALAQLLEIAEISCGTGYSIDVLSKVAVTVVDQAGPI